jgi:mRNA-degrading endonuclease YafQ of YafQ-DinJ toxin-antitoxin module
VFTLVRTRHFDRRLARFIAMHPLLRPRLAQVFRDLEADPFQPHLRLHPLQGELQGLHAVSVTHAYRMTLTLRLAETEIELLDIGAHDELYR